MLTANTERTEKYNGKGAVRNVGRGFRGHGARIFLFAALFLGLSVGPIITNSGAEVEEEPIPALPTNAEVIEGLQRIEKEEVEREVVLAGGAAAQERQVSEGAYADVSPVEAMQLLLAQFPEQISVINSDPARFLSDVTLTQPLGDGTAGQVISEGSPELLDAGIPVLALEADGDLGKVDLTLTEGAEGFEPANPLTDVIIPLSATEDIEVGVEGIRITAVGADGESGAMSFGDKNIFYPDTHTDTDILVSPVAGGVEISDQLRSVSSPEIFRFDLALPPDSELRSDGSGGAEIARGSEILARVLFPTAVDAQGTPVPVELEVEGATLVLHVPHRSHDFAYPILLDPTLVEDWYNASWYGGSNLTALTDANWPWTGNAGWIYHDFKCIWTCWGGSNRGLFISAESGNHAGNEFVQYSYTPPGSTSYITSALINPFWRNNYNCPKSSYPQPHDYDGLWQPSGWAPLEINRANDFGNAQPSGGGRSLIIGLGQGTNWTENKCRRDLMVGGVSIWVTDDDVPSLPKPTVEDDWISSISSINPVSANASDAGLGVKYFRMFTTDANGAPVTQNGFTIHSCTGLRENPCPPSWSTQINNYGLSGLPDGVSKMVVKAYDALGDQHSSQGQPLYLKVDRTSPVIEMTGDMLSSQPTKYHLTVTAKDGSSGSFATARSGMKSLAVYFDDQLVGRYPESTNPPPCTNVQQGIDLGSCEFKNVQLDFDRAISGKHTLKVVATDSVNRSSTKVAELDLPKDTTAPTIVASGPLYEVANQWTSAKELPVSINASDGETGVVEAKLLIDGKQVGQSATQECFYGGCSLSKAFPAELSGYSDGSHTIVLMAKDAAGNMAEKSWILKRDSTAPSLSPLDVAEIPTEWTPQLSSVNFGYSATDSGSGVKKIEVIRTLAFGNTQSLFPYSSACSGSPSNACPLAYQGSASISTATIAQREPTVLVKAYDAMENVSSTRMFTLKVDRTAPQVSATGPLVASDPGEPIGLISDLGLKIQDRGSGVASIELLLDGQVKQTFSLEQMLEDGGTQTCSGETCYFDYTFNPVIGEGEPSGTHTFSIAVRDRADRSSTISHEVDLDARPPDVALDGSLVDAIGEALPGTVGLLEAEADDGEESSGVVDVTVEVDGVPVGPKVDFWVVDKNTNRVKGFTEKGQYVAGFGSYGSANGQFNGPSAIAVGPEGNLWVTDTGNHRVQKFDPKGQYLSQFGTYGTGNGQFNAPSGIAVGPNGWIFVSDRGNHRVQLFNKAGAYLGQGGSYGWEDTKYDEPTALAIGGPSPESAYTVLVVDSGNNRVKRYTPLGEFLGKFGSTGSGPGQFSSPSGVEVDSAGNAWVSDRGNFRIQEFSPEGEYMTQFGSAGSDPGEFNFAWPMGIAANSKGGLWITDTNNDRVQNWVARNYQLSAYLTAFASAGRPGDVAVDLQGNVWVASSSGNELRKYNRQGQLLHTVGGFGSGNGQFINPAALAIDTQGNIWVADKGQHRIQKFNAQGEFLLKFGSYGPGNGQLDGPEGLAIDRQGNIWVSDTYNNRVQKFTPQGTFLKVAVTNGSGAGQVGTPMGIDVAPNGEVWIADWQHSRLVVVDEEGSFVRQIGSYGPDPGQFREPDGIDVDAQGNVWVGDTNSERVQQFDAKGNYVAYLGQGGTGPGQFNFYYPMGLEVDPQGILWIADTENHRIQKWSVSRDEPSYASSFGSLGSVSAPLDKPADIVVSAAPTCEPGLCAQTATRSFSYNEGWWGSDPRSVIVTATDAAGNTSSEEVRVNEPLTVDTPTCPSAEVKTLGGGQALSSSSAISSIKAAIPTALEPSEPYLDEQQSTSDVELEPAVTQAPSGVSLNNMGIDVSESMMGGGIENESGGSFTVGQAHCLQPLENGPAAISPAVVEGAAVVYPNAAPDTDTVIRPTAFGTAIIQHLRGPNTPTAFSWAVGLEENQELMALKNGSIAVVSKEGLDLEPEEAPPAAPGGLSALNNTNAQVEQAEHELVVANNEIEGAVSMVIAAPEVVTSTGQVVPGILRISGGTVIKAELPPNYVSEAEALIIRANPAAEPESMCAAVVAVHPEYAQAVCGQEELGDGPEEPEEVEDLQSVANTPSSSLNTNLLSLINHYDGVWSLGGALASSGSSTDLTKSQKEFCEPERRKIECRAFILDGLEAIEAEDFLFNTPAGSNGTRANAFRHSFWVALMRGSETHSQDGLAWAIAHEHNQWKSAQSRIARESKMDVLNNFVGYIRAGGSDLSSCEIMLDKSVHGVYITANRNPFKWARNNSYEYFRPVYRKLIDNGRSGATGQVVLSLGRKCKDVW